jgi:N-formylglutamate deformylase
MDGISHPPIARWVFCFLWQKEHEMRKTHHTIATIHHGTNRAGILLHIPHSSTFLPEELIARTHLMHSELKKYAAYMADLYTDELFIDERMTSIIAPISRLYCDVERYRDDDQEPMSHYQMGVVYEATYDCKPLIDIDETYRDSVLLSYYDKYHAALDDLALSLYQINNSLIVLDCHSFHEAMVVDAGSKRENYPDICIGYSPTTINPIETKLIQQIHNHFEANGYTVAHNVPFSGSLIPNAMLHLNNVSSVMIEINKRLYLDANQNRLQPGFERLQAVVHGLFHGLLKEFSFRNA